MLPKPPPTFHPKRFSSHVASLVLLLSVAIGCNNSSSPNLNKNPTSPAPPSNRIFAVSYPLQFLTQQIAGEEIEVLIPYDPADDPRTSRPTRETIEAMQKSDLVITNGVGATYAKWLVVVSIPESKVVNAASHGLALREFIPIKGKSIVHSHGPEGEHSHPVMAARTWLDPSLAKKQASYIAKQLKKAYPEKADSFNKNLGRLQLRLDDLVAQKELIETQQQRESQIVLTSSSQFEFLVRAAGFSGQTLPELSENSPENLVAVESLLKKLSSQPNGGKPAMVIYDQSTQLPESLSDHFASLKIQTVAIDLLDHPPEHGDYVSAMKQNLERVTKALSH